MKKFKKTDAAKKLGISRPTLYRMIERGTLVPDENGLIAVADESEASCNEIPHKIHTVSNIIDSSAKLKDKYRDKYIAQLEKQVEFLQQELAQTQREVKTEREKRQRWLENFAEKAEGRDQRLFLQHLCRNTFPKVGNTPTGKESWLD